MTSLPLHRVWFRPLAGGLALLVALPASAALDFPVTVTLSAPGGFVGDPTPIATAATATSAAGISVGDGSPLDALMLPDETIFFVGNSIRLHVAAGDGTNNVLTTGLLGLNGTPASYTFSGLNVPGETITGITVYAFDGYDTSGTSGVVSGTSVSLLNPSTVRFNLDSLVFADRGFGSSTAFGEFRIDLITTPVPEPAVWALFALGLAAVGGLRRHQALRAAGASN